MIGDQTYIAGKLVLVAGGGGLAGSAIIEALLNACDTVQIRATYRSDNCAFIDNSRVKYVRVDLTERRDCDMAVADCNAVVLAAANSAGAASATAEPWRQVTDNVIMDARLLDAAGLAKVERIVYISSASIYQDHQGPIREDQLDWAADPHSAYFGVGWAKRYGEKLCEFWHRTAGCSIIIGRAANIFGPYAKFNPRTANFIPALIRKAVDQVDPFEVWGGPEVARDVIFSADFGRAVVAMLNAMHISNDVFNIGSGYTTTVGEAVELILHHAGHAPSQVLWRNDRPTMIRARSLNVEKAHRLLNWQAETNLSDAIRDTVTWWRKNRTAWIR